jgi:flagellar motor switch protein FliM
VEVKLAGVDQLTYSEFVYSLETPTCFHVLRAEPLGENLILDANPSILFPLIDRLLGGQEASPPATRPLTDIELRLVARITNLFVDELKRTWEPLRPLDLRVERVESDPRSVRLLPPDEAVVLIGFELVVGAQRGMMHLCLPCNALEPICGQLTPTSRTSPNHGEPSPETTATAGRQVEGAVAELVVTLAESTVRPSDLLNLAVGDIIATEADIHTPLTVCVQGVPTFTARPGAYRGRKAIEVDRWLKSAEDATAEVE